jgi:multicomponent Na+:H+ antiporter subunit G
MALLAPHWLILVKLLAIAIFLFLTGPTASHAIANAAHTVGLEPIIGRAYIKDKEQEGEP